jgi:hypothetical protein
MKNGAQHAGKLAKSCLLNVVKAALGDESADNIRLPQRNETIPRLWRGRFTMRFIHEAAANANARARLHLKRITSLREFRRDGICHGDISIAKA